MGTPCGFICVMQAYANESHMAGGMKFRVKPNVYSLLSKGKLFAPHLEEICAI